MIEVLYIVFMALNNRLRGIELPKVPLLGSKLFTSLYAGLATWWLSSDYIIGIIVFIGLWVWAVLGWGKGFSAFHGRYNVNEKEFLPADIIGNMVFRKTGNGYIAGTAWFMVRGLMVLPLYIALAVYLSSPYVVLLGLTCGLLQGPVYGVMRYIPETKAPIFAEVLMGLTLGVFLLLSIYTL